MLTFVFLFVLLYHIYVNNWRQPAVMMLGFFGCLFGLVLPFVSNSVSFHDDDDDDDDISYSYRLLKLASQRFIRIIRRITMTQ